ncbi:MAG: tetratricopeptide repeat protein, partial [Candidatus Eisenbacteria bacterium]
MGSRTVVVVTRGLVFLALSCIAGAQGPGGPGPGAPGRPPMDDTGRGELLQDVEKARAAHIADPGDTAARHGCAQLVYESGDFEGALALLEPLLAEDEATVDVLMLAARIEYLRGKYDRAERLLRLILEREPDNASAISKLIFVYYQTNQYDRCRTLPVEALGDRRIPHLDLMLSFEDEPYRTVWRDGEMTVVPFLVTDPLPVIEVEVNGRKVTVLIDTGGVTLHSVPISVLPTGGMVIGGHALDGILGTGVLKQFLATLDYPNDRLILRSPTGEAALSFYAEPAG